QVARVLRTDSGNDLPWPTANDTAHSGSYLTENSPASDSTDPSFGQVVFKAWVLTSGVERVPVPLLEDNAVNLEAELGKMMGVRIARAENPAFTTGSGVSGPTGVIEAGYEAGQLADHTKGVQYADAVTLMMAVDPAYRDSPDAAFMLNNRTMATMM